MMWQQLVPINEGESEAELKRRFALLFARDPSNPTKAALDTFPNRHDTGRAMMAAQIWPDDQEVKAYIAEYYHSKEHGGAGAYDLDPVRDQVNQAFLRLGGVSGLVEFGKRYPKEFYSLWAKQIPRAVEVDTDPEKGAPVLMEFNELPPMEGYGNNVVSSDNAADSGPEESFDHP